MGVSAWAGKEESLKVLLQVKGIVFPGTGTVSTLVGHRALRSSSGGKLLVPCVNTSTMQRRPFAVVFPSIWNLLPLQIRLLPKSYMPFALHTA